MKVLIWAALVTVAFLAPVERTFAETEGDAQTILPETPITLSELPPPPQGPQSPPNTGYDVHAAEFTGFSAGGTVPVASTPGQGVSGQTAPTAPLKITEFAGLHSGDNLTTRLAPLTPPDPQLAVGPNHLLAMVNSVGRTYDKRTLTPLQTFSLADLFGVAGSRCWDGAPLPCWRDFDPRVLYGVLDRRSKLGAEHAANRYTPNRGKFVRGYLNAVAGTIAGGTSEVQRGIIAGRGLGLPRG